MKCLIAACLVFVAAAQTMRVEAFTPGPHADPEAIRLAQALDFALLQAVNEHKACLLAGTRLGDDLAAIKAALANEDVPALRDAAGGVTLRTKWIMGLDERAQKSWSTVAQLEERIRAINSELGAIAFSGKATKTQLARASDFAKLALELIQDPDYHELYVNGDTRVFTWAGVMKELTDLRPAVQALLAEDAGGE